MTNDRSSTRYDTIGINYAATRREDPSLLMLIHQSLGAVASVANIGAGAGSYEPQQREVIAIEPSRTMVAQRPPGPARIVRASAAALPLATDSVDAAMTVLSLHHWHPDQEIGIREMARIARRRLAIVTVDAQVSGEMWLMADYLHEVRDLDHEIFPEVSDICTWAGGTSEVTVVPISRDSEDWTLMSFWAHPERVLDARARSATSGFSRQPEAVISRVVKRVQDDLESGAWNSRHGHLRDMTEMDAGLRLITVDLGS